MMKSDTIDAGGSPNAMLHGGSVLPNGLQSALAAWRTLLGKQHVTESGAELAAANQSTLRLERHIPAIISPANRTEVQECLRIASRHGVPVYPISRGKNWGLGSCLPTADDCVILDLRRMNRILEYNEELAYLTVEAGVTFEQGSAFLREKQSPHYLCVIGGPPDGSLVGNALERGDGAGKNGDRLLHLCAMEVVLPTGEIVNTGLRRFDAAAAAPVHRYGVGPAMDGIFTQSNFGVVTRATFWLPRKPPEFQSVVFTFGSDEQMLCGAEAIRELMANGMIAPNGIAIWNTYKFATTDHQYPWTLADGKKPLPAELLTRMGTKFPKAKWVGVAGLYSASAAHAAADRKLMRRSLRPFTDKLVFIGRRTARLAGLLRTPLKWMGVDLDSVLRVLYAEPIFLGYPTKKGVSGCYWRKKTPVPADPDPDRDRCGVIWLCPAVPFTGKHLERSVQICTEISLKHGFEPEIAITFPSERCAYVLPSLLYDRDDEQDDAAAIKCHDEMFQALNNAGYLPHRLGVQSMGQLPPPCDDYAAVWKRLKTAFDPDGILAPKRYEP